MAKRVKLSEVKVDVEKAFEWWLACAHDLGVTESAQARVNAFLAQVEADIAERDSLKAENDRLRAKCNRMVRSAAIEDIQGAK